MVGETTFGAELRRLRVAARLKQSELAAMAAQDVTYLSRLENDFHRPGKRTARQIASALDRADRDTQRLRELAFLARGECCPRCGFGGEETT